MNVALKHEQKAIPQLKGRPEPANVDLETAILGGLLVDPHAYDRVVGQLKPEHFYLSYHGKVYAAMQQLANQRHPIDITSVAIKLVEQGMTNPHPQSLVYELFESTPSAVNIDQHVELLIAKWQLRETIKRCHEAARMALEPNAAAEEVRNYLSDALSGIAGDSRGAYSQVSEVASDLFSDIESACQLGEVPYLPTGLGSLDEKLKGGLRGGDLVVIAGRPGMGKSAMAISNLLRGVASISQRPSIVFSLEMSGKQLVKRFLARDIRSPWHLEERNYSQIDWDEFGQAFSSLTSAPIFINDRPSATLEQITAASRRLKAEHGSIGCIVVDYLQIMGGMDFDNRATAIGRVANGLKGLARELDTTVIALSQLNRGVESRTDKRPTNSDLKESGAIEEAADIIAMLYRDEYYNPDTSDRGIAELLITKHRNGSTGTIKLLFDPVRSTFSDANIDEF